MRGPSWGGAQRLRCLCSAFLGHSPITGLSLSRGEEGPQQQRGPSGLPTASVIPEWVAWDPWPSAIVRRGASGPPSRPPTLTPSRAGGPPWPSAHFTASCFTLSTSCPVSSGLWPQDSTVQFFSPRSPAAGTWGRQRSACSAEGPCDRALGPWDTGTRPLGAPGHVPGPCWTQMASSQAQRASHSPRTGTPCGGRACPDPPQLACHAATWPRTCRARAHPPPPVLGAWKGLSHLHLASFSSPSRASPSSERHGHHPPCTPALPAWPSKALPLPADWALESRKAGGHHQTRPPAPW